ncbi:MAG: pyridoxal phosphate-dependent aminotransferase [Actinomycetota bacterium]
MTGRRPRPDRNPHLVDRMQGLGTTIFAEMSALAVATGSVNLGQGFPDTDGPPEMVEAAIAAIRAGDNQYPPGIGIAPLRHAVAAHQERFWGLTYDPDTEVLVTAGATEAVAAALLALLEVGDEVVVFEPYYDSYAACIALAGAQRRCVTLRPPDYGFSLETLRAAVTPRTRALLLNSPHNPTGKVFSRVELEAIAALCIERDLIAITDEVYEHLVYDGAEHVPLATLPGMRDRTVTISSAGKTFSMTGWKTGWVCASPDLVAAVRTVKQFLTYVHGAPFQHAAAVGLGLPDAYFTRIAREMAERRDLLSSGLVDVGFDVFAPSGTYFVTVDIRPLGEHDGLAFCRSLPERCGVVAVPTVVFYDDVIVGAPLVRFTFCKRRDVLEDAVTRLKGLA